MQALDLASAVSPGEAYTVRSLVPEEDPEAGGITGAELATAGVSYTGGWESRFIEILPGSIGDITYQTADAIVAGLPENERDPYHVAMAMQAFLSHNDEFVYSIDVSGMCGREGYSDCLLRVKRGYCELYASTMVMMLRTQSIPARYVVGYLPGRLGTDDAYTVDRSAAHAWVEVYFPRYGWVRFDPTPPGNAANGQVTTELDPGEPEPSAQPVGPAATPSFATGPDFDEGLIQPGGERPVPPSGGAGGIGSPVGIALIVGLVVAFIAIALFIRGRRMPYPEPDLAYRGVARLAGRFGYGPKPTQTAYEFAGSLGEVVPQVRSELQVVAHAKVESTYARRRPDSAMLEQLREAYRRVRVGLLRLVFRRRPRSGVRVTRVTRR